MIFLIIYLSQFYRERELEYVTAINTTAAYSGWLELNVTAPLTTWIAFPDSNKGLYISVHPIDRPGNLYIYYVETFEVVNQDYRYGNEIRKTSFKS